MARGTYSYDPTKVGTRGKDKMRFELGDTMVEGMEQTAFLTDEEYEAILSANKGWKKAKLALIESVMRRFAYEVDEKVGPMSLSLRQRYEDWAAMYDDLKDEVANCTVPSASPSAISRDHYFREGIHNNPNAGGTESKGGGHFVPHGRI